MAELMVDDYLNRIIDIMMNAKAVPFSQNRAVDTEMVLDAVEKIKMILPTEMTQAQKIVSERKYIMDDANKKAEEIITNAEARARELVETDKITKMAKQRALETDKQAKANAAMVKNATDSYILDMLAKTESTLVQDLEMVRKARNTIKPEKPQQ